MQDYGGVDSYDGTGLRELLVQPRTPQALGVPLSLLHDLVLRQALFDGKTSTLELSDKMGIATSIATTIVEELRELRYLEVQGLEGRNYTLALTEAGRQQATDRVRLCRYTGRVPVSLGHYTATICAQKATPAIEMDTLRDAFSDLVVSDALLEELGPATLAGGAMFLYGPPGTGKSSIAERLLRVYRDVVAVPFAVVVDGQIITVFDPILHKPVKTQPEGIDPRWVICERPSIIVGGELTGRMLDLAYEPNSGVYLAPLQMQANNGILVIDDFGRQALTPSELLNRWIVPLDRQVDYLSLSYGVKFEVPFDAKIVFSTNLEPEVLGDEAFFRRIQSKLLIPAINDEEFDEVLRRVCAAKGVAIHPDSPAYLRWTSREHGEGDLRPYLPGAVIKILLSICEFRKLPAVLTPEMIDKVASVYFTHAKAVSGGSAADDPNNPPPVSIVHPDFVMPQIVAYRATLEAAEEAAFEPARSGPPLADVVALNDKATALPVAADGWVWPAPEDRENQHELVSASGSAF